MNKTQGAVGGNDIIYTYVLQGGLKAWVARKTTNEKEK